MEDIIDDELHRTVRIMMPTKHDPNEEFRSLREYVRAVWDVVATKDVYKHSKVEKAVRMRYHGLRHSRANIRAETYTRLQPSVPAEQLLTHSNLERFLDRVVKWNDVKDKTNIMKAVSVLIDEKCSRFLRKIDNRHLAWNEKKPIELQIEIKERCEKQSWPGVFDSDFEGMGRGVIATEAFKKNEIVLDYHGVIVETRQNAFDYCDADPAKRILEYIVEVAGPNKRLVDASSEQCPVHGEGTRCLGRLCNHAQATLTNGKYNYQCNLKLMEVNLDLLTESDKCTSTVFLLIAKHDIPAMSQLRWDYLDKEARRQYRL